MQNNSSSDAITAVQTSLVFCLVEKVQSDERR